MSSNIKLTIEKNKLFIPEKTARLNLSKWNVFQIGAGGTGSPLVARLASMISKISILHDRVESYTIIDGDIVEPKNLVRQWFIKDDLGKLKAQVLAERYSSAFGIPIRYVNKMLEKNDFGSLIPGGSVGNPTLVIGAVDNGRTRKLVYSQIKKMKGPRQAVYWIDAGNGYDSGQVVWGNTALKRDLGNSMGSSYVEYLPYPPLVYPELLIDPPKNKNMLSCAEALIAEEQGPNMNFQMALIVAEMVRHMLSGTLDWHLTTVHMSPLRVSSQAITNSWLSQFSAVSKK